MNLLSLANEHATAGPLIAVVGLLWLAVLSPWLFDHLAQLNSDGSSEWQFISVAIVIWLVCGAIPTMMVVVGTIMMLSLGIPI